MDAVREWSSLFLDDGKFLKLDQQCTKLAWTTFETIFSGLQYGMWEEMVRQFWNGITRVRDVEKALVRQSTHVYSSTGLQSGATTSGAREKSAASSDVDQKRDGAKAVEKAIEEVDPSDVSLYLGMVAN